MQLDHSFTVPAGLDDAWKLFQDLGQVAPCMPGAALDTLDGDSFTGRVKVKAGAVQMSYRGQGTVTRDAAGRSMFLDVSGSETRGAGTASARVTATLSTAQAGTLVRVRTDLDITGRPAQFGRGIMTEVGDRIVQQFATRLEELLRDAGPAPRRRPRRAPRKPSVAGPHPSRSPSTSARPLCPSCSGRPWHPRRPCCARW